MFSSLQKNGVCRLLLTCFIVFTPGFSFVSLFLIKTKLLRALICVSQSDPNAEARCLALAALAMHCVIELIHYNTSRTTQSGQISISYAGTFLIDALVVLLGMMRYPDHSVALVAVEMILMLAEYCSLFLEFAPRFPLLIIRVSFFLVDEGIY